VCRGRRQRNFFAQHLGQTRFGDGDALAGLDLANEARQRPVVSVGNRRFQQRRRSSQRRFRFDRGRSRCRARLERLDPAARKIAAPQAHRILANAERFRNAACCASLATTGDLPAMSRVATRYDKLAANHLAFINLINMHLAAC
jgi:hypothetical protein